MSGRTFLVLGCGSIGRRHIRNLRAIGAGRVVGYDPRADRRAEAERDAGVETVASLDDAWKLSPDVALVTAPTAYHVPLATQAAEHGCHLFIEKPLSHSREGIEALRRAVRDRKIVTLVGCNMRFHPALMRMKSLIDSGQLGHIAAARFEVGQYLPDWHPWEDYRRTYSARSDQGGGVILDDIHELDYAQWMLGQVTEVACMAGRQSLLEIDTEDTAAILLRFKRGTFGEVHLDYVQRAASRSCHVIGTEGTARWDLNANRVTWYLADRREWVTEGLPNGWTLNEMYVAEMRHFIECLDGKTKPQQDLDEAARVLEIAIAAGVSARTRRFVPLTDDAR